MNPSLLFPFVAVALSGIALAFPAVFLPYKWAIVPLLALIMFGMGMTLTPADFLRVLRSYPVVGLGVLLQYTIMPLAAFLVATLMQLPTELTVGLIIVGSCAGGTASNVICYLAKADVALSISLTMVSTLLGVIATPLLTWLYVGERVDVPVAGMLLSIGKIVIIPVLAGVVINHLFGATISRVERIFPMISMLAIVFIIAIIVALNRDNMSQIGILVCIAVILHNMVGLTAGYWLGRLFRQPTAICRTLAIEVGMQNSGLGVALAMQYFSTAAALPGAIFSIWHNISGSLLAAHWNRPTQPSDGG